MFALILRRHMLTLILLGLAVDDACFLLIQPFHTLEFKSAGALECLLDGPSRSQPAIHEIIESDHALLPAELDEVHLPLVAGLDPYRQAAGDVEMHAHSLRPIEVERAVDFEEVVVRSDLNRPVARIAHLQLASSPPGIYLNRLFGKK